MPINVSNLGVVQETLLIPLAARSIASSRYPNLDFSDDISVETLKSLKADTDRFTSNRSSMMGCILRAKWFDNVARQFLAQNTNGLCVSLGSGLDARALRIGIDRYPNAKWIDIDFPDVIKIRKEVIPQNPQVEHLAHDITDIAWMNLLPWADNQPALFLSEGVFMYLLPEEGKKLITSLGAKADEKSAYTELAADYASPLMVKSSNKHPTVSKTQARFRWGIKKPTQLLNLDQKLRLSENSDFAMKLGPSIITIKILYWLLSGGRRFYGLMHFKRPQ